jgi:hypothetical protein
MKKYLSLFLIGLLTVMMSACTSDNKQTTEANDEGFAEESDERQDEESLIPLGETAVTEGGSFTYHARNNRLKVIETESFSVNFDKVSAISGELDGGFKEYLGKDQIEYIQLDIEVENTSSNPMNLNAYQASIVTSTGEEIDVPNSKLSSPLDEKFAPEEKKQGSIFYLLEKSKAEEVEWVQIIIEGPKDENNEKVGEDINIKVKL